MKILTLFLCAVVPLMASAGCPSDWSQSGELCYLFMSTAKSWAQAETYCISQGGHLASVHSAAEFTFLQSLTRRYSWIGGYEGAEKGVWSWTDGTRFDYQNWADGEPTGGQHCLATNWCVGKRWDDGHCHHAKPFICAKNMLSPE